MSDEMIDSISTARRSWWRPALVGLGVVAVTSGGFAVSTLQDEPPQAPVGSAPGSSDVVPPLLVREGDAVMATGGVLRSPGEAAVLCAWAPSVDMAYPPGEEPPPQCSEQQTVAIAGLDESTLPGWSERDGTWFTESTVRVEGTWQDGALAVGSVTVDDSAPPELADDYFEVPCAPPPDGWDRYEGLPEDLAPEEYEDAMAALYGELDKHPDKYHSGWMSYPDGDPLAPGAPTSELGEPMPQHLVRVVTTVEDPAAVQAELSAVYPGNLCVVQVDYSGVQLRAAAERLAAQDRNWFAEPHGDSKTNRLNLLLPVLDEAAVSQLGEDAQFVDAQPFVRPL